MEAKRRGRAQGIKIGLVLLTHLLFVDDIMLFLNDFKREDRNIQEILNTYLWLLGWSSMRKNLLIASVG
jgi:hypothetical protein